MKNLSQGFDGLLDVDGRDGVRNEGVAESSKETESNRAGVEFFVFAERGENGVGRNVGGEDLGKMVTGERGEDLVRVRVGHEFDLVF